MALYTLIALRVHETCPGLGRDVRMDGVPLETTFAVEARLLKRTLRRKVLGVAGRLNSKDVGVTKGNARERLNCLWHETFAPV